MGAGPKPVLGRHVRPLCAPHAPTRLSTLTVGPAGGHRLLGTAQGALESLLEPCFLKPARVPWGHLQRTGYCDHRIRVQISPHPHPGLSSQWLPPSPSHPLKTISSPGPWTPRRQPPESRPAGSPPCTHLLSLPGLQASPSCHVVPALGSWVPG